MCCFWGKIQYTHATKHLVTYLKSKNILILEPKIVLLGWKQSLVQNSIRMMIFSDHPGWRFGLWRITQEKSWKGVFWLLCSMKTIFDFLSLLYIAINFVWDKLYHFLYVTFHLLLFNIPPLFSLNFPILFNVCFMSNLIIKISFYVYKHFFKRVI